LPKNKCDLMAIKLKKNEKDKFPTRKELNQYSVYKLSLEALKSKVFKDMVIDFLVSREYKRGIVYIKDVKMTGKLRGVLYNNDIDSLNDLTFLRLMDVSRMPGIGPIRFHEIMGIMDENDFQFDSHTEGLNEL
jgi:hypothetical protein